jgi:hypothetical protein
MEHTACARDQLPFVIYPQRDVEKLAKLRCEIMNTFTSLSDKTKQSLQDYYIKCLSFIDECMNGKSIHDINICLMSVQASIDYMKLFAMD